MEQVRTSVKSLTRRLTQAVLTFELVMPTAAVSARPPTLDAGVVLACLPLRATQKRAQILFA
jgi:hypothetical protein